MTSGFDLSQRREKFRKVNSGLAEAVVLTTKPDVEVPNLLTIPPGYQAASGVSCNPIQSTFDQSFATTLFQAIRHQTQSEISGAVQQRLRQQSPCTIRGEFKTEICLGYQPFLLGSDPGLALKLHKILQPPEAMNRAAIKNNGELIAIPAGAEHHLRLELKLQQLIRPRCIKEAAIRESLHFVAVQQCLQWAPRLLQIALQLRQRGIRNLQNDAMGAVNLHRRPPRRLMRNDGTINGQ